MFELGLKHQLKQRAGNCFSHSCLSGTDLCFSGINELLVHIALIKESMVPSSVERHLMNPKQKQNDFSLQFIVPDYHFVGLLPFSCGLGPHSEKEEVSNLGLRKLLAD